MQAQMHERLMMHSGLFIVALQSPSYFVFFFFIRVKSIMNGVRFE
jgi:hypothetical protein